LVFLLVIFILGTWFSASRYTSIFGGFNTWHFTGIEMFMWVGLFYALVSNLKGVKQVWALLGSFFIGSFLASLVTLTSYVGVFDALVSSEGLWQVLRLQGFSPAGGYHSVVVLLAAAVVVGLALIRRQLKASRWRAGVLSGMVLLMSVVLGLWIVPRTTSLDLNSSWRIASATIQERPWFGSGPSTYGLAFRSFRPASLNQTPEWNLVFNRSGSEYLTLLTTMGTVGLLAWLVLVGRVVWVGGKMTIAPFFRIKRSKDTSNNLADHDGLKLALMMIIVLVWVGYLFFSSTVVTTGVWVMMLILWMLVEKGRVDATLQEGTVVVEEVVLSLAAIRARFWLSDRSNADKSNGQVGSGRSEIMPWVLGVPLALVTLAIVYYAGRDFVGNVSYARSLRALMDDQPARVVYEAQQKAIQANPFRDEYRRTYAATNISLARAVANQAGESITESQQTEVVRLVQQAIREARLVTEVLNPASAVNWRTRGSVYQSLLGIATGADRWALHAFTNAVNLSPTDPGLRFDVGSFYLTLARSIPIQEGVQGDAPGEGVPAAPDTRQAALARAEAAFSQAAQLKPDYANAYYNLAAVYNEAQRYDLAKAALERTLQLVEPESEDYQRAKADLDEVNKLIPVQ